jgi:hypothetical protein
VAGRRFRRRIGRARIAIESDFWDPGDWHAWAFAFYSCLSGLNMGALILLVVDRLKTRRPWRVGAIMLFTMGMASWLWTTHVAREFIRPDRSFGSIDQYLWHLVSSGDRALPLISLLLLIACLVGGRTRNWWRCRGWWGEWLGMWVLTLWSIPAVALFLAEFVSFVRG